MSGAFEDPVVCALLAVFQPAPFLLFLLSKPATQFCSYWIYLERIGHWGEWPLTHLFLWFFFSAGRRKPLGFSIFIWHPKLSQSCTVRTGGMQPAGSTRCSGDSAAFISCWTLMPALLPRHSVQCAVMCNISARKEKPLKPEFVMKISMGVILEVPARCCRGNESSGISHRCVLMLWTELLPVSSWPVMF